jgi:DNA polymerase-3 subunit delta'
MKTCLTCTRIDHRTYSDFLLLDGEENTIKKEDVQEVLGDFSKTPLEEKGIMVYIIHLVENMTVEAVNSLLKFLEEPDPEYLRHPHNRERSAPSSDHREPLRKHADALGPADEVIADAISLGVEKKDAELLSYFCNNGELIAIEAKEDGYANAKKAFEASLNALGEDPKRRDLRLREEHHPEPWEKRRHPLLPRYAFLGLQGSALAPRKTTDNPDQLCYTIGAVKRKDAALRGIASRNHEGPRPIGPQPQ